MPTKIEWVKNEDGSQGETWNPVTGCTKISTGCAHCYAERMAKRQQAMGNYRDGFKVTLRPERLDQPLRWRKPRRIFVVSMGDLFHEDVPFEFIAAVFGVMAAAPRHTFQVLSKRADRMLAFFRWVKVQAGIVDPLGGTAETEACVIQAQYKTGICSDKLWSDRATWPLPNVWLGVTAEDQASADERIPLLLQCPAAVRWVSVEPMVGAISFRWPKWHLLEGNDHDGLRMLDWIVCGGESGPGARPVHPDWVRSIRDQCAEASVPFLWKQWGEWAPDCLCQTKRPCRTVKRPGAGLPGVMFRCGKKAAGRELDGVIHDGYPEVTR